MEILDYGKHIVGGSILNVVFLYIDNAYVGKLLGVTALGFYAFAFGLANLPTQFITPIINKVTFPSYVKLRGDRADLSSAYLRSLRVVSMITFPATLGLATISSDLLQTLYADKWNPSIVLVQILSVYALFRSIGALPGNVFLTIGKQHLIPRLMLIYVGIVAVLLWPVTRWFGTLGTSLVMTSVIAVGSIVWLVLVNRYLAIPLVRFGEHLAPQSIASVAMVGWLLFLSPLLKQSSFKLAFLIGNGAIMYITCILLVTKGRAYKQMADVVKTLLNISDRSQPDV
jgi:O-antigen/teichoic acid export membrane protein